MGVYDNIKKLCLERGVSVSQLERELGFTKGKLGKMNDSSPSVDTAKKIADRLGVTVDSLVNGRVIEDPAPYHARMADDMMSLLLERWERLNQMGKIKAVNEIDELVHDAEYSDFDAI